MKYYNQDAKQSENREYFKRALAEAIELKMREEEEKFDDIEITPPSKRHKIRMNRLVRERARGSYIPFPEVDNLYERVRSKLVIKLKINKFLDHREKRIKLNRRREQAPALQEKDEEL